MNNVSVDANVRGAVSINADPADYKLGDSAPLFYLFQTISVRAVCVISARFFTAVGVKVDEKLDYLAAR